MSSPPREFIAYRFNNSAPILFCRRVNAGDDLVTEKLKPSVDRPKESFVRPLFGAIDRHAHLCEMRSSAFQRLGDGDLGLSKQNEIINVANARDASSV